MAILEIAPALPDLQAARAHPCAAITGADGTACGATPTVRLLKACRCTDDHARETWLCAVHERMVMAGVATCRDCATLGRGLAHSCPVAAVRLAA